VSGADVQREIQAKKEEERRRLMKMDPKVDSIACDSYFLQRFVSKYLNISNLKDLGKDAATVYRDKRGRKLEMLNELMRQEKGNFKEDEETQMEWGVGLVQKGQKEEKKRMEERERMKPFARTKDDEDMNEMLSRFVNTSYLKCAGRH